MKEESRRICYRTALVFLTLFLICAAIMTIYDTIQHQRSGEKAFTQKLSFLYDNLADRKENQELQPLLDETQDSAKETISGNYLNQYYSYYVWDTEGRPLAKSRNCFRLKAELSKEEKDLEFLPEKVLTKKQIDLLQLAMKENSKNASLPPKYRMLYETARGEEGRYISGFFLEKLTWEDSSPMTVAKEDPWLLTNRTWQGAEKERRYVQTAGNLIMEWRDASRPPEDPLLLEIQTIGFPYFQDSYADWEYWRESEWLHSGEDSVTKFIEVLNQENRTVHRTTDGFFTMNMAAQIVIPGNTEYDQTEYLQVRGVGRPFFTAMQSLRWTYFALFLTLCACAVFVAAQEMKMAGKRRQIEQDRMDFINGMAHELKTPLAVLRMCEDNLRLKELEYKKEYYLDTLSQKTSEMDELIRQMLYLSQLSSVHFILHKEKAKLDRLIAASLETVHPLIKGKRIHLDTNLLAVEVDVDMKFFSQLISNLLSNAVAYVPEGGYIKVIVNENEFSVENEGAPISEAWRAQMFDLFASGKNFAGGREKHLGFGLHLVRRVAELHKMKCEVENTKTGNKFTIRF